ncbi:MAG: tetratricopeptide repeat protein [Desulfobulbaceae bacterium]
MRGETRDSWLVLAACMALGFAVYANSFEVPFYLDDLRNFIDNPRARLRDLSPGSLWRAAFDSPLWTRPLANLSFALNYYVHQESVAGYHSVNILIHALTAFFLFLLTRATLATPALVTVRHDRLLLPALAALLWLVHPLHTQSVTYIVQRMNSMAVMFYLASLWLYARGRLEGPLSSWRWFALAGAAALMAMGSKEVALTLPVFIALYEIYFFRELDRRWLRGLVLVLAGLALCLLLAFFLVADDPLRLLTVYEKRPFTPGERMLTELRVVLWYLGLLFFPHPGRLNLDHDIVVSQSLLSPPATLLSLAAILLLLALAVVLARRQRLLSFALFWYFGNLLIESSFLNLELIFEHRTYLPSIFVIIALVALWLQQVRTRWLSVGSIVLLIALFSFWTVERNRLWQDPVAFWEDSAAKAPGKARPFINLSVAYRERGDYARAIAAAQTAIRLDPRFVNGIFALGSAYLEQGDLDLAIATFQDVLRRMPEYADVYNGLAVAYLRKGMLTEAAAALRENLRLDPDNFRALVNLAAIKSYQGRDQEALKDLQRAVELGGDSPDVLFNLAVAYARSGNVDQAMRTYRQVLEMNPGDNEARKNLELLQKQSRPAP